jgi:hypothetical protein
MYPSIVAALTMAVEHLMNLVSQTSSGACSLIGEIGLVGADGALRRWNMGWYVGGGMDGSSGEW